MHVKHGERIRALRRRPATGVQSQVNLASAQTYRLGLGPHGHPRATRQSSSPSTRPRRWREPHPPCGRHGALAGATSNTQHSRALPTERPRGQASTSGPRGGPSPSASLPSQPPHALPPNSLVPREACSRLNVLSSAPRSVQLTPHLHVLLPEGLWDGSEFVESLLLQKPKHPFSRPEAHLQHLLLRGRRHLVEDCRA